MQDYQKLFLDFWKELVTNNDGSLNEDAVKRELFDYHTCLTEVSKVYDNITGGTITKPNACSQYVLDAVQENYTLNYYPRWVSVKDYTPKSDSLDSSDNPYYYIKIEGFGKTQAMFIDGEWWKDYTSKICNVTVLEWLLEDE